MQLKELLNDDRAVSPVIGVILMVAITVILAAVIGTFVLGLGDQVSQTTPSASLNFDYDADSADTPKDSLDITHNGGDKLSNSEMNVSLSGASYNGTDSDLNTQYKWSDFGSGNDVTTGSTATVNTDNLNDSSVVTGASELDLSEATVRVVWQSAGGDSSAQLGRWSGPDA